LSAHFLLPRLGLALRTFTIINENSFFFRRFAMKRLLTLSLLLIISVSAQDDTTPPILQSLTFTPDTINTTNSSQTVATTIRVTDDLSGVRYARVYFDPPSGGEDVADYFNTGTLLINDTTIVFSLTFPQFSETGDWQISSVWLQDQVGNTTQIWTDSLTALGFPTDLHVISVSDESPPILQSLTFTPDTINTTNSSQTVATTIRVTDDLSGVRYARVYFDPPLWW
jgi:hypothetical protein